MNTYRKCTETWGNMEATDKVRKILSLTVCGTVVSTCFDQALFRFLLWFVHFPRCMSHILAPSTSSMGVCCQGYIGGFLHFLYQFYSPAVLAMSKYRWPGDCALTFLAVLYLFGFSRTWRMWLIYTYTYIYIYTYIICITSSSQHLRTCSVLLGWVAMNDDISQIQILICYHQSSTHRSSWTKRNGQTGKLLTCIKTNSHAIWCKWKGEILSANNLQVVLLFCRWKSNSPLPHRKFLQPRPRLWVWTRLVPASLKVVCQSRE